MDLKEHEGRELFVKYGIPVPRGFLLRGVSRTGNLIKTETLLGAFLHGARDVRHFALKAQLLSGKRGKAGGIIFTDRKRFTDDLLKLRSKTINGEKVKSVLAVEKLDIAGEFYLSITVDRHERLPVLIFSDLGGVDIEETAEKNPERIKKILVTDLGTFPEKETENLIKKLCASAGGAGMAEDIFLEMARNLYRLFVSEDCLLAEINPLILTRDGKLYAADAKITIDDSSAYRHPRIRRFLKRQHSGLEAEAAKYGLSYVELDGDLAIIGNGAGLVMSSLDAVKHYGAEPANFCDLGGGATDTMMEKALETVLKKRSVKAVFINIFGGITRCDEVAKGIARFRREYGQRKKLPPMAVRLVGTNEDAGVKILKRAGIEAFTLFNEAAAAAARLTIK